MSVCGTCHREQLEASRESALGKQVYICGGYEPRTTDLAVFWLRRSESSADVLFAALACAHALCLMLRRGCARATPIGHVLIIMFMHVVLCASVNEFRCGEPSCGASPLICVSLCVLVLTMILCQTVYGISGCRCWINIGVLPALIVTLIPQSEVRLAWL